MTVHVAHWPRWVAAGALAGCLGAAAPARAVSSTNILQQARIEQRLGVNIPLDLEFADETGQPVRLATYFGERPVVLVLAYYECPMLCTLVLNGVAKALNAIDLRMGRDFDVVTVSFNPDETPALAAAKKANYIAEYQREGAREGWHFLTGGAEAIRRLTEAVGFHYYYDEGAQEYAHASGIMVLTPGGQLSKYFYGIDFKPRDLRLGLVDAAERRIGTAVDIVLLWCFHYDPTTGKYGVAITRALQAAAAATILAGGGLIARALWRERRAAGTGAMS